MAVQDYRRSLELSEGESHSNYVNFRPRALSFVGQHANAAAEAEAIVRSETATNSNLNEMARVFATCFKAVVMDESLTEVDRTTLAERYAARSVELLTMAAERGSYPTAESVADLRTDDRLKSLVDRHDFQSLLETLDQDILDPQ